MRDGRAGYGVAVLGAAHFLVGADGLAVATALPALQRSFGATPVEAQWVLSAYGLTLAGFLLLGGRLGDLYGRRRVLAIGMAVFAATSLAAGLAPTLPVLVLARAAQGLGAAVAVPTALALITDLHPPGPRRSRAVSLLAGMAVTGVLGGLALGGVITDLLGWRWVFLILAVPAVVTVAAAPLVLPAARTSRTGRLDVVGAVLGSAGVLLALYGVTAAVEHPGRVGASFTGALLLLALFVGWERRAPSPLLRLGILRVRGLRAASCGIAVNAFAATVTAYAGSLYLQDGLGYSASGSALALAPLNVVAIVASLAAGPLARRPPRPLLLVCFPLTAAALGWLARAPVPAHYAVDVLPALVVLGTTLPLTFVVVTQQAMADVAPAEAGLASGVFESANHLLGGAVGIAAYAAVLQASGYRAAFLLAAALVVVFAVASLVQTRPGRPGHG